MGWRVVFVHSAVDQRMDRGIERVHSVVREAISWGRVDQEEDFVSLPVSSAAELDSVLDQVFPGDLLFVSLHGWQNSGSLWLGPSGDDVTYELRSRQEPVRASVVILDCCVGLESHGGLGDTALVEDSIASFVGGRVAVLYSFAMAGFWDPLPAQAVRSVLKSSRIEPGDETLAFTELSDAVNEAAKRASRWDRNYVLPWGVKLLNVTPVEGYGG